MPVVGDEGIVPVVARQVAANLASANVALTVGVRRVMLHAHGADMYYAVGPVAQTASATSHFIGQGERVLISVPKTGNIAAIRHAGTNGVLHISELA